jgi:hypothetical protein
LELLRGPLIPPEKTIIKRASNTVWKLSKGPEMKFEIIHRGYCAGMKLFRGAHCRLGIFQRVSTEGWKLSRASLMQVRN